VGMISADEGLKKAGTLLRQQRVNTRRAEFVAGLRKATGVKLMLEPPRVNVEAGGAPGRGPEAAPVTIVEFADFQCAYCGKALDALRKVEERYSGKVRLVFRDFPLTEIHPNAAKAAEAGACANDQGKFWPMHDRLFADPTKLAVADLKQNAAELGLDAAAFAACLDSGKHAGDWKKSLEEGQRHGLTGTPAFFINGRLLIGAVPYESLSLVIDEELDRAGSAAPAAAASKKSEP